MTIKYFSKINAEQMHKMCLRKKKFHSYEYALTFAKRLNEKYGTKQEPYLCPLCNCYHLRTIKENKVVDKK